MWRCLLSLKASCPVIVFCFVFQTYDCQGLIDNTERLCFHRNPLHRNRKHHNSFDRTGGTNSAQLSLDSQRFINTSDYSLDNNKDIIAENIIEEEVIMIQYTVETSDKLNHPQNISSGIADTFKCMCKEIVLFTVILTIYEMLP